MRNQRRMMGGLVAAIALASGQADGQETATSRVTTAGVIGSHQIDRFEAIRQVSAALRANPNSAADWVILGELAQEVATDVPTDQDDAYYKMSRESYENALKLEPENAGLKAAVQFARDQEANASDFDARRKAASSQYLDARRREMAAAGINPTVRVYSDLPAPAEVRPNPAIAGADLPNNPIPVPNGTAPRSAYPYPAYQPYAPPSGAGQPITYRQYADGYVPPSGVVPGAASIPNPNPNVQINPRQAAPTTLRGIGRRLPGVILDDLNRGLNPGTTTTTPAPVVIPPR